ncbi:hypothetical protein b3_0244 [Synechococcus phage B3]|nr:hypothetical protein b3_0244 [Synechococcus phage B3]QGT54852.1 hypothetical protein b23_0238 [Synechococcus phage B23]
MNQSFCMASDIETRATMWAAIHTDGTPIYVQPCEPLLFDSVCLASLYANLHTRFNYDPFS